MLKKPSGFPAPSRGLEERGGFKDDEFYPLFRKLVAGEMDDTAEIEAVGE